MKKLLLFISILFSVSCQAQGLSGLLHTGSEKLSGLLSKAMPGKTLQYQDLPVLKTSNDPEFYEDDANTVTSGGGSFFNTTERDGMRFINIGYDNMMKGNGATLGMTWASNITGKRLPLYIEYGFNAIWSYTSIEEYFYSSMSFGKVGIHSLAVGVPLHFSYKLQAGDFRIMPIVGPGMYAFMPGMESPMYGMVIDLGVRAGYKGLFVEYKYAKEVGLKMISFHQVGLSIAF